MAGGGWSYRNGDFGELLSSTIPLAWRKANQSKERGGTPITGVRQFRKARQLQGLIGGSFGMGISDYCCHLPSYSSSVTVTSGSGYAVHAFAVVVYCMYMHKYYVLNRSGCTVLRNIKKICLSIENLKLCRLFIHTVGISEDNPHPVKYSKPTKCITRSEESVRVRIRYATEIQNRTLRYRCTSGDEALLIQISTHPGPCHHLPRQGYHWVGLCQNQNLLEC